jgi:hypothetical protein
LPFSVLRSSTICLSTKGKRAKTKTNATLHTCYILIDVAYCRNLKFMGDIVNWVVV